MAKGVTDTHEKGYPWTRTLVALAIGLIGSVFIWVVTPYVNFLIDTGLISDSFLPVSSLFVILVLLLLINPVLRLISKLAGGDSRTLALDRRQLALVFSIVLMAAVVTSHGLLRHLPYSIVFNNTQINSNSALAESVEKVGVPESLFPDELGYGKDTSASNYFLRKLPPGEQIPWHKWTGPLASWGVMALFSMAMMVGLAMVVLPQWRHNERLAFPLLGLQQRLLESPEKGRLMAGLFRKKSFWIAAGMVVFLYCLQGANLYMPTKVPAIPLKWDLKSLFTEGALRHVGDTSGIKTNQIVFLIVGVTFFMPSRIGFSIVFFHLLYVAYAVVNTAYYPPYNAGAIGDQHTGSLVALAIGVLWLGRSQWARVFRAMFRRSKGDNDCYNRAAGWTLAIGFAGAAGWLMWVGVQPVAAVAFVVIGFVISLVIARLVAETGIPFMNIGCAGTHHLIQMLPVSWLSGPTVLFSMVPSLLFRDSSRISATGLGIHALGMDEDASPRRRARLAWILLGVMMLGVVICGAVHLYMNYNEDVSYADIAPINRTGQWRLSDAMGLFHQHEKIEKDPERDSFGEVTYNRPAHMVGGAAAAGLLMWACLLWPSWPLHPIGLLMGGGYLPALGWPSILLGWLLKVLILHFGGARLYRKAAPFFLGLIVGQLLAAAIWAIIPSTLAAMGAEVLQMRVQPG